VRIRREVGVTAARRLNEPQAWTLDLDAPTARPIDAQCIGLTTQLAPAKVLHVATTQSLFHLVQRQGFAVDQELLAAHKMIAAPDQFMTLPASTILTPDRIDAEVERGLCLADIPFHSSLQKKDVMARVQAAVLTKSSSSTLMEDVLAVTDELFTNAIYNAPYVDFASGKNPGVSRLDAVEVRHAPGKESRLILAADDQRLMVGCADPFGSLNLLRYLHRIKETYVRGPAATMNFGPGGAGLGSYIIFNAGSSLYFGVWPGVSTVLFCVMPFKLSYRKRVELPKHLHWVQRQGDHGGF
jgi:hypothetical protein